MNRGEGHPYPEPETVTAPFDSAEMRCFAEENQAAGPGMIEAVRRLAASLPTRKSAGSLSEVLGWPAEAPGEALEMLERLEAAEETIAETMIDEAIDMYCKVLAAHPENEWSQDRISELTSPAGPAISGEETVANARLLLVLPSEATVKARTTLAP